MIDWWGVFDNALWVVGLAAGLAVLSVAIYEAGEDRGQASIPIHTRIRQQLEETRFRLPLTVSMAVFCLGLLLSGRWWWERIIWGLLTAMLAGYAIWLWKVRRTIGESYHEH